MKPNKGLHKLTELESVIMEAVWALGQATVREHVEGEVHRVHVAAARMVAVRATPTIGPSSGRVQTSGSVVNPWPRRSGTRSSSALHTVGVSMDLNTAIRSLVSSNIAASYDRPANADQVRRRRTDQTHTPASTSAAPRKIAVSYHWNVQYRLGGWYATTTW